MALDNLDQVTIGGVLLHLETSARAKRIQIRVDGRTGKAKLIVPTNESREKAIEFAKTKESWLQKQSDKSPESVPFTNGMILPFKGIDHRVINTPGRRGIAIMNLNEDTMPEILVPGLPEHLPRRLVDWLKNNAKADMTERSKEKSERIKAKISRVQVRDTVSRWGSCSSKGGLSYSWRLILTPDYVRDYMAAHEVAHLKHMNHGARFWALCEELCDLQETQVSELYLKQNARQLFAYGRT